MKKSERGRIEGDEFTGFLLFVMIIATIIAVVHVRIATATVPCPKCDGSGRVEKTTVQKFQK